MVHGMGVAALRIEGCHGTFALSAKNLRARMCLVGQVRSFKGRITSHSQSIQPHWSHLASPMRKKPRSARTHPEPSQVKRMGSLHLPIHNSPGFDQFEPRRAPAWENNISNLALNWTRMIPMETRGKEPLKCQAASRCVRGCAQTKPNRQPPPATQKN